MNVRHFANGRIVSAPQGTSAWPDRKEFQNQSLSVDDQVGSMAFAVISVGNCPQCEELAAVLAARGVPTSVFVKWDRQSAEYPGLKASLQRHAGDVFSFPQVFMEGRYQGGFKEVADMVERGVYDDFFEQEFDIAPKTLQRVVERRAMVVFSLPNCPNCDVLRDDLSSRKVPVQDVFVKLDKALPEYPAMKAQLQKLIGREKFQFPQTFVRGTYQGDFDEVIAKTNKGAFAHIFAEEFGIAEPQSAAPPVQNTVIAFDDDF